MLEWRDFGKRVANPADQNPAERPQMSNVDFLEKGRFDGE
jgi:hypothetical protein